LRFQIANQQLQIPFLSGDLVEEDVLAGLCDALVRNYLNNVGKGKEILEPIVFQGGVSENIGVIAAFKRKLKYDVIIPEHNTIMGAIGAAMLAKRIAATESSGGKIPKVIIAQTIKGYKVVSNLQLYLDLYNFKPRGREHAEYLKKAFEEKGKSLYES
jgi:predicted NodU family carbamoyl transferase